MKRRLWVSAIGAIGLDRLVAPRAFAQGVAGPGRGGSAC